MEKIILAGGCFWCTEAIFLKLKGVESVVSGYANGKGENPTYEEVSTGETGFAEAIEVTFDENIIDLKIILDVFFNTHDPTTLNRQGNDIGTQYRSGVYLINEEHEAIIREIIEDLKIKNQFKDPIVTEVEKLVNFYPAEDYHKNFYENNRNYPYCRIIIDPKVKELINNYSEYLNK